MVSTELSPGEWTLDTTASSIGFQAKAAFGMKVNGRFERYESAIADVRAEAARIRDDARADATRIREELRDQANAEVERIRLRGEEQLASQRDQVVRQLKSEIGGLSIQLAERIVGDALIDEGRQRATVDTFLRELDALSAQGDGREATAVGGPS